MVVIEYIWEAFGRKALIKKATLTSVFSSPSSMVRVENAVNREQVLSVVRDFNKIILALDANERKLFADRIKTLDKRMSPGLSKLSWNSSKYNLDYFSREARKHCQVFF